MLGRTHIALGIASSLIITRPETVPDVIAAVIGGSVGSWVVDVDTKKMDVDQEKISNLVINGLFIEAFVVLDYFFGNGMCQYVMSNWGVQVWGALMGFIVLMLIGYNTTHRTFTHSILGWLLFDATVYLFCRPAAIPFAIGYASHLVVDLFNKKGKERERNKRVRNLYSHSFLQKEMLLL